MTLYFIACVLGQFLQTAAGFGFGILVMAVAGMFLPVTAVASANGILGPLTNLFFLFRYWRKLNLRLIFWPALSGLVAGTVAITPAPAEPVAPAPASPSGIRFFRRFRR